MYTREQASQIKQQFWTSFGKYLSPVLSAEGEKINWINYKTGIRFLSFKMDATQSGADIKIEIAHKNNDDAEKMYQLFLQFKDEVELAFGPGCEWKSFEETDAHQYISRISVHKKNSNVFNQTDWPDIISFLKPKIIALDEFWCNHKIIFETTV